MNLLSNSSLRFLTSLLALFAIAAVLSHCFVFIILFSNIGISAQISEELPYSMIGQGIWSGGIALVTSCILFTFIACRIQCSFSKFYFSSNEKTSEKSVLLVLLGTFITTMTCALIDGYGCVNLMSSKYFDSVGGSVLFTMLLFEAVSLLGCSLVSFIIMAYYTNSDETVSNFRAQQYNSEVNSIRRSVYSRSDDLTTLVDSRRLNRHSNVDYAVNSSRKNSTFFYVTSENTSGYKTYSDVDYMSILTNSNFYD